MRYLLDTNVFIYLITDRYFLHPDIVAILSEPDSQWCISIESVRELIVAYNNKGWANKKWKSAEDMVRYIEENYFVEILPIQKEENYNNHGNIKEKDNSYSYQSFVCMDKT